jgi:hypothetical protein
VSVAFIANALLFNGRAILGAKLDVAVDADEAELAKAVTTTTLTVRWAVFAGHYNVTGIEALDLVELLIMDGKEAGLSLDGHGVIGAFGAIHAEELTLLAARTRYKGGQAVVNVDAIFLATDVYIFEDGELNDTLNGGCHRIGRKTWRS